jgi:hypothetical protein
MAVALASVGFVVVFVVGSAGVLGLIHRALRATEIHARSATALRELEPRGGRHRFHVRLFEVIVLACAGAAGLGVLLLFAASPEGDVSLPIVGGVGLLVAVWWAWRRGTLRAVEAEPLEDGSHG